MPEAPVQPVDAAVFGTFVDAMFSNDGTKLYAVSGNTVFVKNATTGASITQYSVGNVLGGMDISLDGHYLAVVEKSPAGALAFSTASTSPVAPSLRSRCRAPPRSTISHICTTARL